MNRMLLLTLLTALAGCPAIAPNDTDELGDIVGRAWIDMCTEGADLDDQDDLDLTIDGTVVAVAGCADATWAVSVETATGDLYTVGFTVSDGATDLTPAIPSVVEGEAVSLRVRKRLVWGTVTGFVLTDGGGVAVAVEQGGWGGALEDGDVPGLTVALGELVAIEETICEPLEGHAIDFEGDALVSVVPVGDDTVSIGGVPYTAFAVAAWEHGPSATCTVLDDSDVTSWLVYR